MLAAELRKFPGDRVLYLGALPELSVSFLREQGFPFSPERRPARGELPLCQQL